MRAARDSQISLVALGLSHSAPPPDDDEKGSLMAIVAADNIITLLWLGFFDGPARQLKGNLAERAGR